MISSSLFLSFLHSCTSETPNNKPFFVCILFLSTGLIVFCGGEEKSATMMYHVKMMHKMHGKHSVREKVSEGEKKFVGLNIISSSAHGWFFSSLSPFIIQKNKFYQPSCLLYTNPKRTSIHNALYISSCREREREKKKLSVIVKKSSGSGSRHKKR